MGNRKYIVMFATILSLVITLMIQGSVFSKPLDKSLINNAPVIGHMQYNNSESSLQPLVQRSSHDPLFKNIALPSATTTPSTNLTSIFKKVENSVVQITAKTPNPNLQIIINGIPLSNKSTRLGSGFVYDKQGHIITNTHVVDGASTADVTFVDGNTYTAKVIGNINSKSSTSNRSLCHISGQISCGPIDALLPDLFDVIRNSGLCPVYMFLKKTSSGEFIMQGDYA